MITVCLCGCVFIVCVCVRQMVRSRSVALKRELSLSSEVGALKENIKKNRYKDILPYDQSRVVLSLLTSDSDSDYINASFIQGASSSSSYIACQGPLSSTVTDFWRMIWQLVVFLCFCCVNFQKKCEHYWTEAHQSTSFGPFTLCVCVLLCSCVSVCNCVVVCPQMTRSLIQYQFLSWPDHDVPYETSGVLDLLDRARTRQGTHNSPLLVHSAGCEYAQLTADFSIMDVVLLLRRQRPLAVQTKVRSFYGIFLFLNMMMPASHHYDNEPSGAPAAPIYSTVKPRANPHSFPRSTTPIYDIAAPSSQRPSEGRDYQLVSGKNRTGKDEFNCRVQKPRGPRDPPAEWSRLER
uniref:protein-tyrosine-phosphatase n=1 Tax=Acanthochromis polyacanthus TaxID=80966 RepID=A0A3Q1EJ29_9TELE